MTDKITIPLTSLRLLSEVQSRASLNQDTIAEYTEVLRPEEDGHPGDSFPPIIVVQDGDGYIVADGFHRVAAYEEVYGKNADVPIEVQIFQLHPGYTPLALAKHWSAVSNTTHGLRRSKADKANAVRLYLSLPGNVEKSNRSIAKELKVHHSLVTECRGSYEQESSANAPATESGAQVCAPEMKRQGRDAKLYSAKPKVPPSPKKADEAVPTDNALGDQCQPDNDDIAKLQSATALSHIEAVLADLNKVDKNKSITTYTECHKLSMAGQYDGLKLRKDSAKLQVAVDELSQIETVLVYLLESAHAYCNLAFGIDVYSKHQGISVDSLREDQITKQNVHSASLQQLTIMRNFIEEFPKIAGAMFNVCSTIEEQDMVNAIRAKFEEQKKCVENAIAFKIVNTKLPMLTTVENTPQAAWFAPQPPTQ